MKRITALLLLFSIAACSDSLGTEPVSAPDGALGASAQLKPSPTLVIEKIGGDCTEGITVRVTGYNLPARSRFGYVSLKKTDNTGLPFAEYAIPNGSKKLVEWTTFWPAELINPSAGAKFSGTASAWVTDIWTGWQASTTSFIGSAC